MFTELLNPFLTVRNKIKNKDGKWVDEKIPKEEQFEVHYNNLKLSDALVLINSKKKIIIDSFQLSTNTASYLRPRLTIKKEFDYNHAYQNNLFLTLNDNGNYYEATFTYINNFKHPLLESVVHNSKVGKYKMQTKGKIELPNGCKLTIFPSRSYDPERHVFSVSLIYREIEVL